MKRILIIILFLLVILLLYPIDYKSYQPIEYDKLIKMLTNERPTGTSYYGHKAFRIHAKFPEYPKSLTDNDIKELKRTLSSLGIPVEQYKLFDSKIEYYFKSNSPAAEDGRLTFFIQAVQVKYFKEELKVNDEIYWFTVFNQFNTYKQRGFFLVSDFLNKKQFKKIF